MIGSYGPQAEPYKWQSPKQMWPKGYMARGSYSAKIHVSVADLGWLLWAVSGEPAPDSVRWTRVAQIDDDDGNVHLDVGYKFGALVA